SSFFKNGLREELKDLLLARDLPEDFNAFAQLCIKLDNAWHARQMEKKQSSSSRSAAPAPRAATSSPAVTTTTATTTTTAAPRTSTGTAPGPMELDASRHITPETRQYRKENGLCMYCGGQGHFASVCRNKKKPPRHTAAVATATPSASSSAPAPAPAPAPANPAPNGQTLYVSEGPAKN